MRYLLILLSSVLVWVTPVWADVDKVTLYFVSPWNNDDNTPIDDLQKIRVDFELLDTNEWIPSIEVLAPRATGGSIMQTTADLTYPNGGTTDGIIKFTAIDSSGNEGTPQPVSFTAAVDSTIGPPGQAAIIGACTN